MQSAMCENDTPLTTARGIDENDGGESVAAGGSICIVWGLFIVHLLSEGLTSPFRSFVGLEMTPSFILILADLEFAAVRQYHC